jgi:son of sevenless-like protein
MSALINALSSTAITRLHLTWAHVGKKSNLDTLLKYNEPTGGFSGYRNLLQTAEGPCVPFIGMFLTDIVHIQDQFGDNTSPTAANPENSLICFVKRQRWYDVITTMLRHQQKPYNIAECESTRSFIENHIQSANTRDPSWFWSKSQEVQHSELAHADIRRGLVEAGFDGSLFDIVVILTICQRHSSSSPIGIYLGSHMYKLK